MESKSDGLSRSVTRREVLTGIGTAAVAATLVPGTAAAAAPPPANFLLASSRLCGVPLDQSYSEMAGAVWLAVTGKGDPDYCRIIAIAAETPNEDLLKSRLMAQGLLDKACKLIATWYNGWADTPAGPVAASYDAAVMWQVCDDWTKPPGDCGGPFGYWHEPPQA